MALLSRFYPDRIEPSIYDIDFEGLYSEGKRGILLDIDNTLVTHGADADKRSEGLFVRLHAIGFKTCVISNNDEERVLRFVKDIETDYVYKAGKPKTSAYVSGMAKIKTSAPETIYIGDQIFTDIYGAKRAGIDNILVRPVSNREDAHIVFKRLFERIVLKSYEKDRKA